MKKFLIILIIVIVVIIIITTTGFFIKSIKLPVIEIGSADLKNVRDGSYLGEYESFLVKVVVKVDVMSSKITSIEIIEHQCGFGKKAEKITKEIEKHSHSMLKSLVVLH